MYILIPLSHIFNHHNIYTAEYHQIKDTFSNNNSHGIVNNQDESQLYANVDGGSVQNAKISAYIDDEMSIYSNITSASNPLLVAKTEALLQELESEAPMLSKDLKLKIVKAILDEEPESLTERQEIDSDEGMGEY